MRMGEDNEKIARYNQIFRQFAKWFLKYRMIRYILNGKMEDDKAYINYKNFVYLKFIDNLDGW